MLEGRKSSTPTAVANSLGDARPLAGIRVLDFSTLLPGPLATLMLVEAGAEVLKIERPGGDELRGYTPKLGPDSANFALLNRGKRSLEIDLKAPGAIARLEPLITSADVVIEQFRPGVMDRLGLGYESMRTLNPGVIYCSITGFAAHGALANFAGHDINYQAQTGMLALSVRAGGAPAISPALIADIGGGSYPAVINILMALLRRMRTGAGCRIEIAMADCLYPFIYWALADGFAGREWPQPDATMLTGGSCRYNVWRAADGRYLSAAPLEDRFWRVFCETIGLAEPMRDDSRDPRATRHAIAERIASRTLAQWESAFADKDACVAPVVTLEDAVSSPVFAALFARRKTLRDGRSIPALPLPLAPEFLGPDEVDAPELGEANAAYLMERSS